MKLIGFMFAAAMVVAPSLSVAASMRCGKHLVLEGYNFDQVVRACGEADSSYPMAERYIYKKVQNSYEEAGIAEVIKVDLWVYRGAENDFTRNLYFENGILVKIELGDRD